MVPQDPRWWTDFAITTASVGTVVGWATFGCAIFAAKPHSSINEADHVVGKRRQGQMALILTTSFRSQHAQEAAPTRPGKQNGQPSRPFFLCHGAAPILARIAAAMVIAASSASAFDSRLVSARRSGASSK